MQAKRLQIKEIIEITKNNSMIYKNILLKIQLIWKNLLLILQLKYKMIFQLAVFQKIMVNQISRQNSCIKNVKMIGRKWL